MTASPSRHSHADLTPFAEMAADCRAVAGNLHLERAARRVTAPAPSITYDAFPREVRKPTIEISAAAAALAAALHLHLD